MNFIGKVVVLLKEGVFDPQGVTIKNALHNLSFSQVSRVRTGKYFEVEFEADSESEAENQLKSMCQELLSNPVIEEYSFQVETE
ncbi:MAG: phosphoribosylformylglycinamidine synthase subunit PurS [Candidatus Atribacteria bacterium]|nr:phosphoribosylformylglycinamidine synthase subunit PurS [Candidatus Atribacteria bacterium]